MGSVDVNPMPEVLVRPRSGQAASFVRNLVVLSLVLVVATLALYYPVHQFPFINYDDRDYVYENPQVESGRAGRASNGRSPPRTQKIGIP